MTNDNHRAFEDRLLELLAVAEALPKTENLDRCPEGEAWERLSALLVLQGRLAEEARVLWWRRQGYEPLPAEGAR